MVETIPHDPLAFTQGLINIDGVFYESTGAPSGTVSALFAYKPSSDRPSSDSAENNIELARTELRPADFSEWIAGSVPNSIFAEGLELVGNQLYQLSWLSELAFVWELDTSSANPAFIPINVFTYSGEGWGLCYDGAYLYMSNGTHIISRRNPNTFEELGQIVVKHNGENISGQINELECAEGYIWANLWFQDDILRIHPRTGKVTGILDASQLEQPRPADGGGVLNGIAYEESSGIYWLTGKYWGHLYGVRILASG